MGISSTTVGQRILSITDMALIFSIAAVVVLTAAITNSAQPPPTHGTHPPDTHPPTTPDPLLEEIANLKQIIEGVANQMVMQQLYVEENYRSSGGSGLKQMQVKHHGTKSYFSEAHNNGHVGGMRDYPHTDRHLYIAKNTYVMNGVEFRMKDVPYSLKMPSTKSTTLHVVEDIPFPEVPPSVLSKHNITEQIHEMTEYFRAFKHQDKKIRADYNNYFKPVVCYLEGAWFDMKTRQPNSWLSQAHAAELLASSGDTRTIPEYLPVKIMKVVNDTQFYAQWNYRTVCHPIKQELNLYDFFVVDDLAPRFAQKKGLYDFSKSEDARFKLARGHGHNFDVNVGYAKEFPANSGYTTLDKIMEEIPGKDNYPADLNDKSFGLVPFNAAIRNNQTRLNTGYYHRWYKVGQKGAMGTTVINRGFTDQFLFTAQTTQSKVAPMSYSDCHYNRTVHKTVCVENVVRYSYAIPLEIVWMTPLLKWNPYNLMIYHGDPHKSPANIVNAHGRYGGRNATKALNGVNSVFYHMTPIDFFERHAAVKGVLDRHGKVQLVTLSGTRTILPDIKNVGPVRLRYPIVPLHQEGNAVYKQLDALKEIVMNMAQNARIFQEGPSGLFVDGQTVGKSVVQKHYITSRSTAQNTPPHTHDVYIDADTVNELNAYKNVTVYTSLNEGHMHEMTLSDMHHHHITLDMVQCDGSNECFDGHLHILYRQKY